MAILLPLGNRKRSHSWHVSGSAKWLILYQAFQFLDVSQAVGFFFRSIARNLVRSRYSSAICTSNANFLILLCAVHLSAANQKP